MTVNQRLFLILEQRNLKASDLSKCLNIRDSTVSSWKQRGTSPPSDYILRICEFLGVSIQYLLTGENCETNSSLSSNELELLSSFKLLPEREQIKIIGIVEEKAKEFEANQNSGKSLTSKVG